MLSSGDVYCGWAVGSKPWAKEDPFFLGNFWGNLGVIWEGEYSVVMSSSISASHFVRLPNGDIYGRSNQGCNPLQGDGAEFVGNLLSGPASTSKDTEGAAKGKYGK